MTKKEQQIARAYQHSTTKTVEDHYKMCSYHNILAERQIKDEMRKFGGHTYKVCSGKSKSFTCAYMSGNARYLIYYTRFGKYKINLW